MRQDLVIFQFFLFLIDFSTGNDEGEQLCTNGVKPGNSCHLVPTSGYECLNSTATSRSWCENFGGTFKCCEKQLKPCRDRSAFCRLTRHQCTKSSSFAQMKAKCEKTCGFCNIEKFDNVLAVRERIRQLNGINRTKITANPKKCVFPKEKMLKKATTTTTMANATTTMANATATMKIATTTTTLTTNSAPINRVKMNSTTNKSLKNQRKTTNSESTIGSRTTIETRHTQNASTFSSQAPKLTLDQLMTTKSALPKVSTGEPSSLTTSLSKTVIKGTCFDDYIYCREFVSLCSHPTFFEAMSTHCSLTCDRCDEVELVEHGTDRCENITPECDSYKDLCEHEKYKILMKNYCPKSCGHCEPKCRDRHQNCAQYKSDGFCHDEMYTKDEIKFLCGATCSMCHI